MTLLFFAVNTCLKACGNLVLTLTECKDCEINLSSLFGSKFGSQNRRFSLFKTFLIVEWDSFPVTITNNHAVSPTGHRQTRQAYYTMPMCDMLAYYLLLLVWIWLEPPSELVNKLDSLTGLEIIFKVHGIRLILYL